MSLADVLPRKVVQVLQGTSFAEFATMSAKGVPIDTPLLSLPDEDLSKITMTTGLAYPAKAERARRNPKVGLLYYPLRPGEPMVQITGLAAVRDRDIQQNLLRYLAETGHVTPEVPYAVKREAVWYWARILIEIYPKQILWWDDPEAVDQAPHRWDAPADAVFPPSDPAPPGPPTPASGWAAPAWRQAAEAGVSPNYPAYATLVDEEGFPRVVRARDVALTENGLRFSLPAGTPGRRSGPACLTYFGRDTFVGSLSEQGGGGLLLEVERTLPVQPVVAGTADLWNPPADMKGRLMGRLSAELDRRGLPMPVVPLDPPEPTPGARRRAGLDARGADDLLFERPSR